MRSDCVKWSNPAEQWRGLPSLLTFLGSRHTLRETCFSQTWQPAKINNPPSECRWNRKKSKTRSGPGSSHSQGYQQMTCWNFNCRNASCGLETKSNQHGSSFLFDAHPKERSIFDQGFIYLFWAALISRSGYTDLGDKQMTLYG